MSAQSEAVNQAPSRPRRSRQCRGPRARNYVRTLARVSAKKHTGEQTAAVLKDAERSGALANFRRQQEQAVKRDAAARKAELAEVLGE